MPARSASTCAGRTTIRRRPASRPAATLSSQEFGAFLPDFGTIGTFDVPPIEPESFFDVFFDVPLAQLPPPPPKVLPNGGPPLGWPCPPDTVWAGNVDVVWDSLGVPVNVWKHFGNLLVNPGAGASLIHVVTDCAHPGAVGDRRAVRRVQRHPGGRGPLAGAQPAAGRLDRVHLGDLAGGHAGRPGLLLQRGDDLQRRAGSHPGLRHHLHLAGSARTERWTRWSGRC